MRAKKAGGFLQLAALRQTGQPAGHSGGPGFGRPARDDLIAQFHAEGLQQHVCFNLEMWSEPLFREDLPGKHRYVGYGR